MVGQDQFSKSNTVFDAIKTLAIINDNVKYQSNQS